MHVYSLYITNVTDFTLLFMCFKMTTHIYIYENRHVTNWVIWLAKHLPRIMLSVWETFYLVWTPPENVCIAVKPDKGQHTGFHNGITNVQLLISNRRAVDISSSQGYLALRRRYVYGTFNTFSTFKVSYLALSRVTLSSRDPLAPRGRYHDKLFELSCRWLSFNHFPANHDYNVIVFNLLIVKSLLLNIKRAF